MLILCRPLRPISTERQGGLCLLRLVPAPTRINRRIENLKNLNHQSTLLPLVLPRPIQAYPVTPLQANALLYETHRLRWPDYARALELAKTHRMSDLAYSDSDRLLLNTPGEHDEMLHIGRKKYYNLIPSITRNDQEIMLGFLQALQELEGDDVLSRQRYEYQLNPAGAPIKKILKQVCFMDTQQRIWARRFCADFLIEIDATFDTNKLKMLLFVAIGVTNTGLTFPVAFSFAISESKMAFDEFLSFMNDEVWIEGASPPRIICMDQGKGLIASLPKQMPAIKHQLCQ